MSLRVSVLWQSGRPQPPEGPRSQQRVHQTVEGRFERGAPGALVPDRVLPERKRVADEGRAAHEAEHGQVVGPGLQRAARDVAGELGMTSERADVENIQVQFHNLSEDSRLKMEHIQQGLGKTHIPTYQYDFVWENWKLKGISFYITNCFLNEFGRDDKI